MVITHSQLRILKHLESRNYIDCASIYMVEYSKDIHALHDAGYLTLIKRVLSKHYVITDYSGKREREAIAYAEFKNRKRE